MSAKNLGRLRKVELRAAWASEAGEFTPWLAQANNLKLLGETIGIDLELVAQEKDVGPFRADIFCKDTATGRWVLVENQLERTDHSHLGQLITYAAGLDAEAVVWIAERFTDEHRAAMQWLNDKTKGGIGFFALEVELWQIGDSPFAPKFNVVCAPNVYIKTGGGGPPEEYTDAKKLQFEFWTKFKEFAESRSAVVRLTSPAGKNWIDAPLGRVGIKLAAVASWRDSEQGSFDTNELRAELVTYGSHSKSFYQQLELQKAAIEAEFGEPLLWYLGSGMQCRIYVRRTTKLDDRNTWPEQHKWLLESLERLHKVFAPRVNGLKAVKGDAAIEA